MENFYIKLLYVEGNPYVPGIYFVWRSKPDRFAYFEDGSFFGHLWHFELTMSFPRKNRQLYYRQVARQLDRIYKW